LAPAYLALSKAATAPTASSPPGGGSGGQAPANDFFAPTALANVVSLAEEIQHTTSAAKPPDPVQDVVCVIVKAARSAGVTFFERVNDGELVAEGLGGLAPNVMQSVQANWLEIRSALLPPQTATASLELLDDLGVELNFVDTEAAATEQVERLCRSGGPLGLDLETAPRSEFLPILWPIAITGPVDLADQVRFRPERELATRGRARPSRRERQRSKA
jgi:hypothetical protein